MPNVDIRTPLSKGKLDAVEHMKRLKSRPSGRKLFGDFFSSSSSGSVTAVGGNNGRWTLESKEKLQSPKKQRTECGATATLRAGRLSNQRRAGGIDA